MNGGLLGVESFPTTADGHRALSSWMFGFDTIERVGVEGTGAYGAGIARHLMTADVAVIEVDRPNRQKRRQHGKSDELDAIEAARGTLSGRCVGRAKSGNSHAEALRALLVAKRSARSTWIRTLVQLRYLMFTAPDELRARLGGLSATQLVNEAAKLRAGGDIVMHATKTTAVILARRIHGLIPWRRTHPTRICGLVRRRRPDAAVPLEDRHPTSTATTPEQRHARRPMSSHKACRSHAWSPSWRSTAASPSLSPEWPRTSRSGSP